jgi:hypothetical protein
MIRDDEEDGLTLSHRIQSELSITLYYPAFIRDIDAVTFPKTVELVVLSTVCVWPIVVPLMTVTTSVEMSVTVLKLGLVGESVRVDVVVEGAVTSAGTLKIPAQHVYIELILQYLNPLTLSRIIPLPV